MDSTVLKLLLCAIAQCLIVTRDLPIGGIANVQRRIGDRSAQIRDGSRILGVIPSPDFVEERIS